MNHNYLTSEECACNNDNCPVCVGGLAICKVCGLAEGCLTTDCPGERVNYIDGDLIYKGYLDFRNDKWCPLPNPTNQQRQDSVREALNIKQKDK